MGKASRRKGAEGEQAVARLFRDAGWDVRGVQRGAADAGDLLATRLPAMSDGPLLQLVLDSKRQERIRLLEWSRQVEGIARDGEVPVVVYRPSREPWRVSMRLDDLLGLLAS
jgi:hypothetical protein